MEFSLVDDRDIGWRRLHAVGNKQNRDTALIMEIFNPVENFCRVPVDRGRRSVV